MVDEDASDETDAVAPEDAFSLVANETRMDILQALWAADDHLPFSTLRERTGVRDSGQFNYHLGKLVGRFVEKTDAPQDADAAHVYGLRYPGKRIMGAVHAGTFTRSASVEDIPVDGSCYDCGGDLTAGYADEWASVECGECGLSVIGFEIPPVIAEQRDPSELPRAFDDWARLRLEFARRGFCPVCNGPTTPRLYDPPSDLTPPVDLSMVAFDCDHCDQVAQSVVGAALLAHPTVAAFHLDHGVDLAATRLWELDWLFEPHATDHEDGYEITVGLDDERLVVEADRDLAVVDSRREPR